MGGPGGGFGAPEGGSEQREAVAKPQLVPLLKNHPPEAPKSPSGPPKAKKQQQQQQQQHKTQKTLGGVHRGNLQGKDFRGVEGYLNGIWGNPSLVKIHRKTNKKQHKNLGKTKKSVEQLVCFYIFGTML